MSSAHSWRLSPFLVLALAPLALATTCDDAAKPIAETTPQSAEPPRARLRISGAMQGRLEPCGCASGQLGGLPRRVFYLNQERDWDLLIEGGNLVAGGTPLDAQKLLTALQIMAMPKPEAAGEGRSPGYNAIGLGPEDLKLPRAELAQFLDMFQDREHGQVMTPVASDLVAPEGAEWPAQPFLETAAGEARVRVASLILTQPAGDDWTGFRLLPPAEAWQRAMAGAAEATYRVLLVHGPASVARAQAALRPSPDLIVGISDEISEPAGRPEPVDGIPLVFTGIRGRMIVEATLARVDGKPQLTQYRVVPLAASETAKGALEDHDAKLVLLQHRNDVQAQGIREQMAGRLPTPGDAEYVGSAACGDCHEEALDVWKKTKHAHAWETLEKAETGERYGWPVTAYPDCVSCHVVGYGYRTGFVNPQTTPLLKDVGCESCHGPSGKHVASGGDEKPPADAAAADGNIGVSSCVGCHDFEQSPGFHDQWAERWKKIEHY